MALEGKLTEALARAFSEEGLCIAVSRHTTTDGTLYAQMDKEFEGGDLPSWIVQIARCEADGGFIEHEVKVLETSKVQKVKYEYFDYS